MGKETAGRSNGNQGPVNVWERLAAASNNYGEQQPDEVEVRGDMQDGDETQGEQGVATPMTLEEFDLVSSETVRIVDECDGELFTKLGADPDDLEKRYREMQARQAKRYRAIHIDFDEQLEALQREVYESQQDAEHMQCNKDRIEQEYVGYMREAIIPLVESDELSDGMLERFSSDLDKQQERGELSSQEQRLLCFVRDIAERDSQRRKETLRIVESLMRDNPNPWEAQFNSNSPGVCLIHNRESLPEKHQYPALKVPVEVWRQGEHAIGGYIRGILEPYVCRGIISPQYSVHVNEGRDDDKVYIREVRIESDCGGFSFSEDVTGQPDS